MLPVVPKVGSPITDLIVADLERSIAARVADIDDINLLEEWRAQAKALEGYLRGKEMQRPILGAARRIEARIGALVGYHGSIKIKDAQRAEHRISDQIVSEFHILSRALAGECEITDEQWRKSRRALVSLIRQKLGLVDNVPPMPDGKFRCIVADPPWKLDTGPSVFNGTGERGHDNLPYEQLSITDIAALPVWDRAADDAHLYLWTTNRYVLQAYEIAEAWGFKPSVLLVWCKKPRGVGLGDAFRLTTEYLLYARRGSLKEKRIVETTWFNWKRGRHSAKPEEFYQLVESVSHAPYLELYARKHRPGWTCWGDEVSTAAVA
jgi:N6-adenosine-specific RNA methylase IME4